MNAEFAIGDIVRRVLHIIRMVGLKLSAVSDVGDVSD